MRPARRCRPRASAATAASTRAFSLTTCRNRRSSGVGEAVGVVERGVAQRREAEQLRGARALLAALVVARDGVGVPACRSPATASVQPPRSSGTGRDARARRSRSAARGPRGRGARRAGRAARCARPPTRSPRASRAAPARGGRPARPRPSAPAARGRGRSPARPTRTARRRAAGRRLDLEPRRRHGVARRPQLGHDPAREGAPAARGLRAASSKRVLFAEVAARRPRLARRRARSALTVTPRAIANGRQRPSL